MSGDGTDDRPVVLAVDDEPRVAQAFALWLGDDYEVFTATGGEEALELMDDGIDLVLLDRHMPGLSGDEVLQRIREAGYGCKVAMVTAVDPDFDIVELPFDDYVSKPVDGSSLADTVERLLAVRRYDDRMAELYTTTRTIAALESEKSPASLEDSEEYAALLDRRATLQGELDELMASMDADEVRELFELLDT